jgi:hypothetical protein
MNAHSIIDLQDRSVITLSLPVIVILCNFRKKIRSYGFLQAHNGMDQVYQIDIKFNSFN